MYIIRTFKGDVKIDFDELELLKNGTGAKLLFFRQGAVNPAHIVTVVEDEERVSEVMKLPGDTEESIRQRIRTSKSVDIFKQLRETGLQL